jgi:hypothetical protein
MTHQQLLKRLDKAWIELKRSISFLSDEQLVQTGVVDNWSIKDILAHVTTWEEEALKHLPHVIEGKRPPKYSDLYGGIDGFNALKSRENEAYSLAEVLNRLDEVHSRLVSYIQTVPEEHIASETRFRRRLRLDTYSHYPLHTKAILDWREQHGY